MPHREGYSIWVVHGVPHREGYSIWVVHGVPSREGYSMGGPSLFTVGCETGEGVAREKVFCSNFELNQASQVHGAVRYPLSYSFNYPRHSH